MPPSSEILLHSFESTGDEDYSSRKSSYSPSQTMPLIEARNRVIRTRGLKAPEKNEHLRRILCAKARPERHGPISFAYIPKGGGKPDRRISVLTVEDQLTSIILMPGFAATARLMARDFDYGPLQGRGREQAVTKMVELLSKRKGQPTVLIKADLESYFDNLPQNRFRERDFGKDQWTYLLKMIGQYNRANKSRGRGIPQGAPISPLLACYVGAQLMREIEEISPIQAMMYVDDVVVIAGSKTEAKRNLAIIRKGMSVANLKFNRDKTQTIHWSDGEPLNFLGYDITSTPSGVLVSIPPKKIAAFQAKLRTLQSLSSEINGIIGGWVGAYSQVTDPATARWLNRIRRSIPRNPYSANGHAIQRAG